MGGAVSAAVPRVVVERSSSLAAECFASFSYLQPGRRRLHRQAAQVAVRPALRRRHGEERVGGGARGDRPLLRKKREVALRPGGGTGRVVRCHSARARCTVTNIIAGMGGARAGRRATRAGRWRGGGEGGGAIGASRGQPKKRAGRRRRSRAAVPRVTPPRRAGWGWEAGGRGSARAGGERERLRRSERQVGGALFSPTSSQGSAPAGGA